MKQSRLKKIAFIIFFAFFLGALAVSIHLAYKVKALEAQKRMWVREKYGITVELKNLNKSLKKFHEMVKEQGGRPFYEKFLNETEGEKAKDISEGQINFDFLALNFIDDDSFFGVIQNIIRGLKMRLFSHYKDAFVLFAKSKPKKSSLALTNIPSIWPTEGTITSKFG